MQLAATSLIVLGLVGLARLASSDEGARKLDQAAEQTRQQLQGADRDASTAGIGLEGRWRVDYEDAWFTGTLIYELRREDTGLKGYLIEILDEAGRAPVDDSLILEMHAWNGSEGEGLYYFEYQGERYEAACRLEALSSGELRVRYDVYGYRGDEMWHRVAESVR